MKILFIVNPVAGRQIMEQEERGARNVFTNAGHQVLTLHTLKDVTIKEQLSEIPMLCMMDLIVCAGGDGTLNQTVFALLSMGLRTPLGYLPIGTTNDFATTLKLSKRPSEAARNVLDGKPRSLDAGRFGLNRYFVYVASFGAFTHTSYTTTQSLKNTFGHLAYIVEGLKELPKLKGYGVKVDTGEEQFEGEYIFGAVSNSSSLGGVIRLAENLVETDDGKFELTLVKMPKNLAELSRITLSLMSGSFDPAVITFRHVTKAEFSSETVIPWSLDGEFAQEGNHVAVKALPAAFELWY